MIRHYLKMAFRNLLKYKAQTAISIIGLAFGFACFALSSLWIRYIMTYDDFHEGVERIYVAEREKTVQKNDQATPTSGLLAGHLRKEFPEIETACHISWADGTVMYKEMESEMSVLEIDSAFITMFRLKTIDGNAHFLLNSSEVAISRRAARTLFGHSSPIGETIYLGKKSEPKVVAAIVEEWKGHSNLSFDILSSASSSDFNWNLFQGYTLLRTTPGTNITLLRAKLKEMSVGKDSLLRNMPTYITPLTALQYTHPIREVNVKLSHVRLFALIGGLVIACGLFNYLVLYGIRIRMRKRELALRKVNGASDGSLLMLLISELLLLLFISLLLGMVLIEFSLPLFKRLSQIEESTVFFYKESAVYLLALIAITLVLSFLSLRCIHRAHTLHHNISGASFRFSTDLFRKGGLLFQLIISIGFIFCTSGIMKQLHFLRTSDEIGWERKNIGRAYLSEVDAAVLDRVLKQAPTVVQTLKGGIYSTPIPNNGNVIYTIDKWEGGNESVTFEEDVMGEDYMEFFHITLLQGSIPDKDAWKGKVLINEAAAKRFGWDDPIGKKITSNRIVQGVIKNIHEDSPVIPVFPVVYVSVHDPEIARQIQTIVRIFKFKEGTWQQTVDFIQAQVHKEYPDCQVSAQNMEEEYDKYLKSEETLMKLLGIVSAVCVVVSIFGIFSLVTLSCERRRKEIAIRKVNGATVRCIWHLFVKEYMWLLLIASGIAFPISYLLIKSWLENYVKQTTLGGWIYVAIFVSLALLILLTVGWRVGKAARQNPAETIKTE